MTIEVGSTLSEITREHIIQTLAQCGGNRTHASKCLGISIRCLRNKLHEYTDAGIEVPPVRSVSTDSEPPYPM